MNYENLHELINRYTADFARINNSTHDEIFKWRAVKHFQTVWFSEGAKTMPFALLFKEAKKECNGLMDNAYVYPATGIVKLAEREPAEVEHLFRDVLFANDGGNIRMRQNNMEQFLNEFDKLLQKVFPGNWKYKQDPHSISCYLTLFAPEKNYLYKPRAVDTFAEYTEFGHDIGTGKNFNLENYYKMCDIVVDALREHNDLLDMHFSFIDDTCYRDDSLHIMAFDLIYCVWCYCYCKGLTHKSKKEIIKGHALATRLEKERLEYEEKITSLEVQIHELEVQCEQYQVISLNNVEVFSRDFGKGLVILQEYKNPYVTIKVKFADCDKSYQIHRTFTQRPTFENDEEIVNAFTEYADVTRRIKGLRAELEQLRNLL